MSLRVVHRCVPVLRQLSCVTSRRCLHKKPSQFVTQFSGKVSGPKPPFNHIVQVGDPVLRVETQPVNLDRLESPEIQFLMRTMKKSLDDYDAVGVSAPQLGVPLKMFAVQITERQISGWSPETIQQRKLSPIPCRFFINPVLKIINSELAVDREGCCSVYGYSASVARAKEVEVRAFDETGKPVTWAVKDWTARVVQHEMDHLKGVLYTDKMSPESFAFNYWQTVNNRSGQFKLGYSGVNTKTWRQYFFPKLKQN